MFGSWSGLTQRQLASWLLLFFLALLIPSGVLIYQSYSQLKWEAFHRHRLQAEELMVRIDRQLNRLIGVEQQRNSAEYGFLLDESGVKTSVLQRSPLSSYPVNTAIPGLLGYFQVDADGHFSTPLLPIAAADLKRVGFAADEYQRRLSLEQRIRDILSENRLVDAVERPGPVGVEPPKRLRDDSAVSSLSAELSDEGALAAREAERDDRLSNDADLMGARPLAPVAPAQAPAVNAIAQQGFDQLKGSLSGQKSLRKQRSANLGRVEDLKLEKRYQGELAEQRRAPLTEPGPERIEPL